MAITLLGVSQAGYAMARVHTLDQELGYLFMGLLVASVGLIVWAGA